MNLEEEKAKLLKEIEETTNQLASLQIALSVAKSKLKKITKLIDQAKQVVG